jgi:hypothetical protein
VLVRDLLERRADNVSGLGPMSKAERKGVDVAADDHRKREGTNPFAPRGGLVYVGH